jgi:ABC-type antimicrobial peptide transport system permease subunit
LTTIASTHLTIASEGVPVEFSSDAWLALRGLALAVLTGSLSALIPAWRSSRRAIVESLRS